jgi:hypothetical protein
VGFGGKGSSLAVGSSWEEEIKGDGKLWGLDEKDLFGFMRFWDMLYSIPTMIDGVGELLFVYFDEATKHGFSLSSCFRLVLGFALKTSSIQRLIELSSF